VVGLTHREEGEYMPFPRKGGDRIRLTLSDPDEALIQAVAATNPRTAVVLMGGGPILCEGWRERVAALLIAWYPGMEGGHALADVLFGRVCPGGRLPCVFPRSAEHLPFFDPEAETIEYGLFHGYRLLEKEGHRPAFPFGFGLSYTRFTCTELELEPER
jgi:beta-glucosidase